jgi:hypothetical protein
LPDSVVIVTALANAEVDGLARDRHSH